MLLIKKDVPNLTCYLRKILRLVRFNFMIITNLIGGLGNQMFQYAVARKIAIVNKVPLKLDITGFQKYLLHTYRLDHFCIDAEIATIKDIRRFKPFGNEGVLNQIIRFPKLLQPYYKRTLFKEQSFIYDPNIRQCHDDVYLEGYWQSEKYFKDIEEIIREDFTVSEKPDYLNKQLAEMIGNCEAVSLHIRRGDYISNPVTNAYHGSCSEEYYREAISKIESNSKNPHFFVFSDDPKWVKENFDTGYPTIFIDFNGPDKDYEDLRLMSLCQHHIIANSSFSWWGAWLCQNTEKIVIAPKKWFNDPNINTQDLIPQSWIRI
jgi:hypothetical protein